MIIEVQRLSSGYYQAVMDDGRKTSFTTIDQLIKFVDDDELLFYTLEQKNLHKLRVV